MPLSGPGSQYPEVLAGAKAAVAGINSRGGIKGHPVELVYCDDQNNVNQGEACAREMVSDGVVAIADNYGNYGAQELPILAAAHIPLFAEEVQSSSLEYNSPEEFDIDPGALGTFASGAVYGKQVAGYSTYAFDGVAAPIVVAIGQNTEKSVKLVGGKWVGELSIPLTATEFAPYVAAAQATHAQVVFLAMSTANIIEYALAAEQAGLSFHTVAAAVANTESQFQEMGPDTPFGKNMLFASPVPPRTATAEFPVLKLFNSDIAAEYARGDSYASPGEYSISQEQEWYAFYALAKIANMMSGSTVTAATITAELNQAKDVNLGLQPPWTSPTISPGPSGYTRVNSFYQYMLKLQNGQLVLASPNPVNVEQYLGLSS